MVKKLNLKTNLKIIKIMYKYLFTINGHDFVTKKCMILEILLYWNVYIKKTMPFRKDILNSWSYHITIICYL